MTNYASHRKLSLGNIAIVARARRAWVTLLRVNRAKGHMAHGQQSVAASGANVYGDRGTATSTSAEDAQRRVSRPTVASAQTKGDVAPGPQLQEHDATLRQRFVRQNTQSVCSKHVAKYLQSLWPVGEHVW